MPPNPKECVIMTRNGACRASLDTLTAHSGPGSVRFRVGGMMPSRRLLRAQASSKAPDAAFGRPCANCGHSAYPHVRFVSLVENGTHVLFGTCMGAYKTGEVTLAKDVLTSLRLGMLCLADRCFYGFGLWTHAQDTGADLLWRVKVNLRLPCEKRLPDGSYLSRVYETPKDQRRKERGVCCSCHRVPIEGS